MVENLETPSWVSSPQMEGYIVGVGMANPSIGDFHEQKLTAQKDAIDNIKKQKAVTTESEVSQLKFWINPNTNDLYLMMGLKIKPE
jgi:hypothetical protein